MKLLIFLVLSRYGLACKYRVISQISIFNSMQNCIFRYFWFCILIFLRLKYNFCIKSDGLSHDELRALSSAQMAILHRASSRRQLKPEKKDMDQDRILVLPDLKVHLEHNLYF